MGLQTTFIVYNHCNYPHYFLCSYLPLSAGRDSLSRTLLGFKEGLQPYLDAWIECVLDVAPGLAATKDTIIVRALRHDERSITNDPHSPMDLLGQALASRLHCHYLPGLLCKSNTTPPSKGLSRGQRIAGLRNIYFLHPLPASGQPSLSLPLPDSGAESRPKPIPSPDGPPGLQCPPFLLIDDILTTGTTARMIFGAIQKESPASPLGVFTLAKSGYSPHPTSSPTFSGQPYHPGPHSQWIVAEDEPAPCSVAELKNLILANSF